MSSSRDLYRILATVDKTNREPLYLVYEGFNGFKAAKIKSGSGNNNSEDNKESKAGEQKKYNAGIKATIVGLFSEHRWTIILSGTGILMIISVIRAAMVVWRWSITIV